MSSSTGKKSEPKNENKTKNKTNRPAKNRRIDPSGKHALFSAPVVAAPDQLTAGNQKEGRAALFSTGPRQVGTVVVECSSCLARVRCSLLDVSIRLLTFSAWLPARQHGHWMRCPACGRHNWCSIAWND